MKIVFVENSTFTALKFRLPFLKALVEAGHVVTIISGDRHYLSEVEAIGVSVVSTGQLNNRSVSVLRDLKYAEFLKRQIAAIRPDIVFTYQLKPNIYGCIVAKMLGVKKIVATIEGIGDPFIKSGIKWASIRFFVVNLLKIAFRNISRIVFLNKDNEKLFLEKKICKTKQAVIIDGVGVDTDKFAFSSLSNFHCIVMVSRLLKSKGVLEYCEAASIVKKARPDLNLIFQLYGEEKEIRASDLNGYIASGSIQYKGFCDDIGDVYKKSSIVVLPSYAEGMPMSLMEAMSVGRPIIATDVPGCREVVRDGWNGYLVPRGNSTLLAESIIKLASSTKDMITFGQNSRQMVEEKFSVKVINDKLFRLLN